MLFPHKQDSELFRKIQDRIEFYATGHGEKEEIAIFTNE